MNRKDLYHAVNEVDDDILERSEKATVSNVIPMRRRWPVALIAAILCMFLMGAGVVAIIYGDSIQSWFGHYFGIMTGQEMSEGQSVVLDHLSQEIGHSKVVGETKVTVDSTTVGDDIFYILLRVEGLQFSKRENYEFEEISIELAPAPMKEVGGVGSFGPRFMGVDGDGAMLLLLEYSYATSQGFELDTTPLEVHLALENLARGHRSEKQKIVTEGVWEFDFIIDRSQPPESISLPDTEVNGANEETGEEVSIKLSNIVLTNTGIRFTYDYKEGTVSFEENPTVLLQNGAEIGWSDGSGTPMADQTTLNCSYHWSIPVNLDEVQAVRVGSVDIPVG